MGGLGWGGVGCSRRRCCYFCKSMLITLDRVVAPAADAVVVVYGCSVGSGGIAEIFTGRRKRGNLTAWKQLVASRERPAFTGGRKRGNHTTRKQVASRCSDK